MHDLENKLVEIVVQLAAARRLRERHFRELRFLRDSGADVAATARAIEDNKATIQKLHQMRKDVAAELRVTRK